MERCTRGMQKKESLYPENITEVLDSVGYLGGKE